MKTARDYLKQPYARIVIPVGDNEFHAEILEFPGCFSQGSSPEEAYLNLEETAESWINSCLGQGQGIPDPSTALTYSGKIVLRLPKSDHRMAAQLAEREQTSLNTYLVSAVATKIGAENFYKALADRFEKHMAATMSGLAQAFCGWADSYIATRETSADIPPQFEVNRIEQTATSAVDQHTEVRV